MSCFRISTNSNLGGYGAQVYEHGTARNNNITQSQDTTTVSLNPRPDLRVDSIQVPDSVTAGTTAAVSFTVSNMGPVATSGQWTDYVYLSLDGILSGDEWARVALRFGYRDNYGPFYVEIEREGISAESWLAACELAKRIEGEHSTEQEYLA